MNQPYDFEIPVQQPFNQAIDIVTAALKAQGFGVLTRIDVHTTLKEKINVDFRPYVILGACNPSLAHQSLTIDPRIGLMLPCNVTIESVDATHSLVRLTDPGAMVQFSERANEMDQIARQGHEKMAAVAAALRDL